MSETIITIERNSSVTLSSDVLDALGVEVGAELSVEIVGRSLIVRSIEEARRSSAVADTFNSILEKRRTAYIELGKGPTE